MFLHGSIKEEVYVEKHEGFEIYDRKSHICRLKKALYGLKEAPRAWYERIDSYLMKLGFTRSEADPNLYFKVEDDKPLILVLYVDDLFLIGAHPLIQKCKRELASEFEMKDQGLEVWQKPREIFPSQGKYVVNILERFGMVDYKLVTTSRSLTFRSYMVAMPDQIREMPLSFKNSFALMFLVNLCPNICFVVSIEDVSSFALTHPITSLSLLHIKESLLYCVEKGLSLTHVKPEATETEVATAEVKFDLCGLEDLLI
eukprot:PITA_23784